MANGTGTAGDDLIDNRGDGAARILTGNGGNDTILGGSGAEVIWGDNSPGSLLGEPGFDQVYGGGNYDLLADVSGDQFVEEYYGGGGPDEFAFFTWRPGAAVDVVMDFEARNPQAPSQPFDTLDVEGLLQLATPFWDRLIGEYDPIHWYDPWAGGYLRLGQLGADTLLQFDLDGADGPLTWETVVRLKNVEATQLTDQSFSTYFMRDDRGPDDVGSEPQFAYFEYAPVAVTLALEGDDSDETLAGYRGLDIIYGGGGDDNISGGDGNDVLKGGTGSDTLRGGGGSDIMDGGADDDILSGGGGDDLIRGGTGNDVLRGGTGVGGGFDRFEFVGGDGQDILADFTNGDRIVREAADFSFDVNSVAALKAAVLTRPDEVTVTVSRYDVHLGFADGDSLHLRAIAAEWLTV